MQADANDRLRSRNLKTRLAKRGLGWAPDGSGAVNFDHHMAQVLLRHSGFCNKSGELVDRHLEFSDCNWLWDNDASRQSFDLFAAAFVLGRAHHELAGGQGDQLGAIRAILEGGMRLQRLGHALSRAYMAGIRHQNWEPAEQKYQ